MNNKNGDDLIDQSYKADIENLISDISTLLEKVKNLVNKLNPLPAFLAEVKEVTDLVSDETRTYLLDPSKAILDGPLKLISGTMTESIRAYQDLNNLLIDAIPHERLSSGQSIGDDPRPSTNNLNQLLDEVWTYSDNMLDAIGMTKLDRRLLDSHRRTIELLPESVRSIGLGAICLYAPGILDLNKVVKIEPFELADQDASRMGEAVEVAIAGVAVLQVIVSTLDAIPDMFPMTLTTTIGFSEIGLATGSTEIAGPTAMVTKPFQIVIEVIEVGLATWVDRH